MTLYQNQLIVHKDQMKPLKNQLKNRAYQVAYRVCICLGPIRNGSDYLSCTSCKQHSHMQLKCSKMKDEHMAIFLIKKPNSFQKINREIVSGGGTVYECPVYGVSWFNKVSLYYEIVFSGNIHSSFKLVLMKTNLGDHRKYLNIK